MLELSLDNLSRHAPHGGLPLASTSGYLIRRTQQMHNVIWAEELGGELTSPQYAVLAALAAWPRIDQRRLGELASLDKSSIADVVARLVSRMWIVRKRDENDARRNVLELTPAAAIAFNYLTPAAQKVQERLLAPLRESLRPALVEQLQAVARIDPEVVAPSAKQAFVLDLNVPGHLIRRAQQVHTALWAEEFDRELTGPQYAVLHVVSQWPGVNQRQLGELAALDKSTGADLIDRLDRRGWIRRDRDPQDGRGKVVFLTEPGGQAVARFAPRVATVQDKVLEPLTGTDQKQFVNSLAVIAFTGDIPDAAL